MLYTAVRRGRDKDVDDNVLETEREGKGDGNRVNFFELFFSILKFFAADHMELFCLAKR